MIIPPVYQQTELKILYLIYMRLGWISLGYVVVLTQLELSFLRLFYCFLPQPPITNFSSPKHREIRQIKVRKKWLKQIGLQNHRVCQFATTYCDSRYVEFLCSMDSCRIEWVSRQDQPSLVVLLRHSVNPTPLVGRKSKKNNINHMILRGWTNMTQA